VKKTWKKIGLTLNRKGWSAFSPIKMAYFFTGPDKRSLKYNNLKQVCVFKTEENHFEIRSSADSPPR